jgi:predicted DNA binding CopG/RHH family protein
MAAVTKIARTAENAPPPRPVETPRAMNVLTDWEDVPLFDSEEAEAMFWADTRPAVRLMESSVAASAETTESVTITLRMDPRMLSRLKRLARARYLNYQSMIKQWLSERLEAELRERGGNL